MSTSKRPYQHGGVRNGIARFRVRRYSDDDDHSIRNGASLSVPEVRGSKYSAAGTGQPDQRRQHIPLRDVREYLDDGTRMTVPARYRRAARYAPLPPMPLSELPSLKALLLAPVVKLGEKATRVGRKRHAKERR